jgi:hypothetical protein
MGDYVLAWSCMEQVLLWPFAEMKEIMLSLISSKGQSGASIKKLFFVISSCVWI